MVPKFGFEPSCLHFHSVASLVYRVYEFGRLDNFVTRCRLDFRPGQNSSSSETLKHDFGRFGQGTCKRILVWRGCHTYGGLSHRHMWVIWRRSPSAHFIATNFTLSARGNLLAVIYLVTYKSTGTLPALIFFMDFSEGTSRLLSSLPQWCKRPFLPAAKRKKTPPVHTFRLHLELDLGWAQK